MSAKDMIVEIALDKMTLYAKEHYEVNCDGHFILDEVGMRKASNDIADQILDSLPRLSRDKVKELSIKLLVDKYSPAGYSEKDIDEIVDQICSLVPEQQTVQEFAEEIFGGKMRSLTKEEIETEREYEKEHYQVCNLTPACEVIATGKLINGININKPGSDYPKVWLCDIAKKLINRVGQSGTLIWVPDKEVEDEVPACEVIAEGKVKDDAFEYAGGYKIGGKDIDSFFYEHHNQSGTLVWFPSKEDK